MKSAPLCDATLPLVADPHVSRPFPQAEQPGARFGAMLEEATADHEIDAKAADTDDSAETEETKPSKPKKQDDNVSAAPLICFCPPPKIDPVQIAVVDGNAVTEQPVDPLANQSEVHQTVAASAASDVQTLTDLVRPKDSPASKGIELDPKLFKPVSNEEIQTVETNKSVVAEEPETQPPALTSAAHGTLAAKLENSVKNTEKTAEFAPVIEQKMPGRELLRRTVVEAGRVESFHADKQPGSVLTADFDAGVTETIPVKSLEAVRLVETIRTEVTSLRMRGDATLSIVLRPDSGTQLALDLSIGRDGTVHAQARCERGDFQTLQSQWPELQQSLAAQGIRIADLSNQNNSQQSNHRSAEAFQDFERGQNSPQRDERDLPSFEDQFGATRVKISPVKPQPQPATPTSPTRRWQSWA